MALKNSKSIFVTFGAGRSGWIGAAKRITAEAEKTDLFEFCFNLDERWLKTWDPELYKIGLNLRKNHPPEYLCEVRYIRLHFQRVGYKYCILS